MSRRGQIFIRKVRKINSNNHLGTPTPSAWRNKNNVSAEGVGILIDSTAENTLAEITKWNNRILIVNFNGNPKTIIIIHYSVYTIVLQH